MNLPAPIQAAILARDSAQFIELVQAVRGKTEKKKLLAGLSTASILVLQDPYSHDLAGALDIFEGDPTASDWSEALASSDPRVRTALDQLWGVQRLTMDNPWPQAQILSALDFLPSLISFSPDIEEEGLGKIALHAPQLVHLYLEGNGLQYLDVSICSLGHLETLNLKDNSLETLPERFGDLKALVSLDLSQNHLNHLPDSFGNCFNLEQLDLSQNPLLSLPGSISNFVHLKSLSLGQLDRVGEMHIPWGQLHALAYLSMPGIGVEDIRYLGELTCLHTLNIANNPILRLPSASATLSTLTISSDQLPNLSTWLHQLPALSTLRIEGGGMPVMMDLLLGLPQLRRLQIQDAPVPSLSGISHLAQLTDLSLIHTEINAIPEEIRLLKRLQELRIEQNPLQQLPNVFGGFEHLNAVHLNFNLLPNLPDSLLLNWSIRALYAHGNPFSVERLEDMRRKGRRI